MYNGLPTTVEIELSTRCNASCPQCSRNYFGAYTWPGLPLLDIDVDLLKDRLDDEFLSNLKKIRLFGTYGDPCMHPKFLDIVAWLTEKTPASIIISTNGGLRSRRWWAKLGRLLRPTDKVIFCVDGLEDTNHLYRKDTVFAKIQENISAFNSVGGKSIWHFIVFEHNQHQVESAREISKQLGCEAFAIKKTARFINKQHKKIEEFPVLDKNEKIIHWLKLPTEPKYRNIGYQEYSELITETNEYEQYLKTTKINCIAQEMCAAYISAEGYLLPCGWLADRFYGFEAEGHKDRQHLFEMIEQTGGFDKINLKHNSLKHIIQGEFFEHLKTSWSTQDRLERCANQCGIGISAYSKSAEEINQIIN